jgi:hypothetical protein
MVARPYNRVNFHFCNGLLLKAAIAIVLNPMLLERLYSISSIKKHIGGSCQPH